MKLFSEEAKVVSPLYGEMLATEFYKSLFQDTNNSETKFLGAYQSAGDSPTIMMHFNYEWTFKNGTVVNFECRLSE